MKRHLARIANTDQRIVVVFMQIPDDADHALVVAVDNLPPRWEQHLMTVLESPEGQGDPDLGNVLHRRMMPDTTQTLLSALHTAGLLIRTPIDNILMMPEPNRPYPLRQILQAMGRLIPEEYATILESETAKPLAKPVQQKIDDPYKEKFNPHTSNQGNDATEQTHGLANGLLIEADLLEQEAKMKRERAYAAAPHLRPAPVGKTVNRKIQEVSPIQETQSDPQILPDKLQELVVKFMKENMSTAAPVKMSRKANVEPVKRSRVKKTNV
jgi:hypothetical protein